MAGPGWLSGVGMENSQLSCRVGRQDEGNVAGALLARGSFLSSEAWGAWLGACYPLGAPLEATMTGPVSAGGDITTHRAAVGCQGPCGSTLLGGELWAPVCCLLEEGASGWGRPAPDQVVSGVSPAFLGGGQGVLWPQLDCVSLDDGTQGSSLIDRPPQPRAPGGH